MRRSRAGESLGMTTVDFSKPSTNFTVHSITWRALPSNTANGTACGSGSGSSAVLGYSRHSFSFWRNAARRHIWSSSSTARQHAPTFRPPAQKGAAAPGVWPFARRLFDQNPPQDRSRRQSSRLPPDRWEVSDSTQFETSLDIGPDIRPRIAITDKGYDSQDNRAAALARGITPVIPRRGNSKQRGRFFPKRLYKLRARIEQTIGKLKRFKRVAMRCEKTGISCSAIISFACGLMLVKSVHTD